jgi:hypothetical protein
MGAVRGRRLFLTSRLSPRGRLRSPPSRIPPGHSAHTLLALGRVRADRGPYAVRTRSVSGYPLIFATNRYPRTRSARDRIDAAPYPYMSEDHGPSEVGIAVGTRSTRVRVVVLGSPVALNAAVNAVVRPSRDSEPPFSEPYA